MNVRFTSALAGCCALNSGRSQARGTLKAAAQCISPPFHVDRTELTGIYQDRASRIMLKFASAVLRGAEPALGDRGQ
jgi:hypothetical protein